MRKPPRVQELAQVLGLLVGQVPVAHLDGIQKGPVVGLVVVEVDGLLDAARVDAGEAPHGLRKVAVGAGIIGGPTGVALAPIAAAEAAPAETAASAASAETASASIDSRRGTSDGRRPTRLYPGNRAAEGSRCTRGRGIRERASGTPSTRSIPAACPPPLAMPMRKSSARAFREHTTVASRIVCSAGRGA